MRNHWNPVAILWNKLGRAASVATALVVAVSLLGANPAQASTGIEPQVLTWANTPASSAPLALNSTWSVTAVSDANLEVTIGTTTPEVCTFDGGTLTIVSGTGPCEYYAEQLGNDTYAEATRITESVALSKLPQTLYFDGISNQSDANSTVSINFGSDSNLVPSSASSTPLVCTVASNEITVLSPGTCSITVTQAGNKDYEPARPVTQSFEISSAKPTMPKNVWAVRGSHQVTIHWNEVTNVGDAGVEGYTVTASPSGRTCSTYSASDTSCTIQNLEDGIEYGFSVYATNAFGNSPASVPARHGIAVDVPFWISPFSCGVNASKLVECWGDNNYGRATPPSDLVGVKEIGVGEAHACALTDAGKVKCWGYNSDKRATVPSWLPAAEHLSVGNTRNCIIAANGALSCFGSPDSAYDIPNGLGSVSAVSVGLADICAIKVSGQLVCWGKDRGGIKTDMPSGLTNVIQVEVAADSACALKSDHSYLCWGSGIPSQEAPAISGQIVKIGSSQKYICALNADGVLSCWGDDWWGRISQKPANLPPVSDFSIGRTHICVTLKNDAGVQCWGYDNGVAVQIPEGFRYGSKLLMASAPSAPQNVFARRADKSVTISLEPPAVNGGAPVTGYEVVTYGYLDKRCTIDQRDPILECTIDGLVNGHSYSFYVRAINAAGTSSAAWPVDAKSISGVSGNTQCAVLTNHHVTCWGGNSDVEVVRLLPNDIDNAAAVVTNGEQNGACIVTTSGTIRCWGSGWGVTLFEGPQVPTDSGYVGITSSQYTMCAWKTNGDLRCWGWSGYDQISGINTLGPVSKITGTLTHGFCAVLKDSTYYCWGSTAGVDKSSAPSLVKDFVGSSNSWCAIDMSDALSCGGWDNIYSNIPSDLGAVKAVALENENACVIKADDTVTCWGASNGLNNVPADLGTVKAIYIGWNEIACAIRTNGHPQCWGSAEVRGPVPSSLNATPGRAPSTPTRVGARNTTGGVEVAWREVQDNGGFAVTSYTVTATPGGKTCNTSGTSCIVKGLANGQRYTFRVTATNAIGTSAASSDIAAAVGVSVEARDQGFGCVIVGELRTIECWGYDDNGRTSPPTDFENVTEIGLGVNYACAINTDGALRCWGYRNSGEVPTGIDPVSKLSVGRYKTCVITTNKDLYCWATEGAVEIPETVGKVIDVSVGMGEICAIREDGSVTCWSDNGWWSQNGLSSDPSPAVTNAKSIAVGERNACAILNDGTLTCWGDRAHSLLPNDLGQVKKIDITYDSGYCAITIANKLRCWGDDWHYRFSQIPTSLQNVGDVSVSDQSTCVALLEGKGVRCWGRDDVGYAGGIAPGWKYGSTITAAVQPSAPRNAFAVFGDGKATVHFEAPSNTGGIPVASYIVKAQGTSLTCEVAGSATDLTCDVTGLTNGTKYTFSVVAQNEVGISKSANAVKALDISGRRGLGYCVVKTDHKVACWGWVDSFGAKNTLPASLPLAKKVALNWDMDGACIITMQDTLSCWGGGWPSGNSAVPELNNVVQIEMGLYHGCALMRSGSVRCWGYEGDNRTAVPSDLGPVARIFASMGSTCALQRDGLVRCWGADNPPAEILNQFTDVISMGIGDGTWCVIRSDHSLTCYGSDPGITNLPADLGGVKSVTLGEGNACAILLDDSARCWGWNDSGKNEVPNIEAGVAKIVAGREISTCLIDLNGEIYCWGFIGDGRNEVVTTISATPGGPPSTPTNVRVENAPRGVRVTWDTPSNNGGYPITSYTATAHPGNQTCSTTVGGIGRELSCVILGISAGSHVNVSVTASTLAGTSEALTTPLNTSQVSVEYEHVCAVSPQGSVNCWGWNEVGQTQVPAGLGVVTQVATSNDASCALNSLGEVKCWGQPDHGGTAPSDLDPATKITMGANSSCALLVDTSVRCWGQNSSGQNNIPNGTTGVIDISAQENSTCLVFADHTSACYGQVNSAPGDLGGVLAIVADQWHTCAMLLDHSLKCWGSWGYVPSEFEVADSIKSVQVNYATTCVIRADDTVSCWGYRGGLGSYELGTVKSISHGWESICAVTMNDQVVCTGNVARVRNVPLKLAKDVAIDVAYPPSSPLSIESTVEDQSVVVSWQAPARKGGSPITGYTAYIPQTNEGCHTSVQDVNPLSCSISLPSSPDYDVIVYATNAIGDSVHFTFNAPRKQQMYFSPSTLIATASDGEVVNMATQTPLVCRVLSSKASALGKSMSQISLLKAGTCTLTASVPGDAPTVSRSFVVKPAHRFAGLAISVMHFNNVVDWTEAGRDICYRGSTPLIDSSSTWPNGRLFNTDCPDSDFMIHYTGFITWPGEYDGTTTSGVRFHPATDDGFQLSIDDEVIIDDRSYHGEWGQISREITHLAGAKYKFEAWMFSGGAGSSRLYWDTGDGDVIIPAAAFTSGVELPKETQALTWSNATLALQSGRVGQMLELSATSDAEDSDISYRTETPDTCEITGIDLNQVLITDNAGTCTVSAFSDGTDNTAAATPIQHAISTLPGYGVTITETGLTGVLPFYLDNYIPGVGFEANNYRRVAGTSNVPDPLSNTAYLYCLPQDSNLTPLVLASGIALNESGGFEIDVEIPRNIGGVAGCKLGGAVTGLGIVDTWKSLKSDPIRPVFIGTTFTNNVPTDVTIDYWGNEGRASYGLDWACPLCAMHASNEDGSFVRPNQQDPMSIDNANYSLWSYAGTHNPMPENDGFKLPDPSDSNSTIDYSDFTVDGQPVYTSKMALDRGVTFGENTPSINVSFATNESTGAFIITEVSPLWRCTNDGSKLWSVDCGNVIMSPVTMTRITTIQATGTSYYIEDKYVSTDGQTHTLVTASEIHSTSAANLQVKITSGITTPMSEFDYVQQSQNLLGTGSVFKLLAKFDGQGSTQENETLGSASFSPSPTRFVTSNSGPNEESAHGMSLVYENQQIPANGTPKTLRQAYSIAHNAVNADEGLRAASTFVSSGRLILGQRVTFDAFQSPGFAERNIIVHGNSTSTLPMTYTSATPLVCSIRAGARDGHTTVATATFVTAGTCRLRAEQVGNDIYLSTASELEFMVLLSTPSVPRSVTQVISGSAATVSWQAPIDSGGSPIAKYVVTATSGDDVVTTTVNRVGNSATPTSATLNNLRQGATYQITVTAFNSSVGLQTGVSSNATTSLSITIPAIVYTSGMKWTVVGNKPVKVGNTLSAVKGTWAGSGITYKYQWFRCAKTFAGTGNTGVATKITTSGAGKCVAIPKATATTYKLVAADKGKFIALSTKAVSSSLPAGVTMYTKSTTVVK